MTKAQETATIIRNQIGGGALFMIGAKNLLAGTDKAGNGYLVFMVCRNPGKVKWIQIALDRNHDLYIVDFKNRKGENLRRAFALQKDLIGEAEK